MTRVREGPYKGKEWELLVKPVIEKWGTWFAFSLDSSLWHIDVYFRRLRQCLRLSDEHAGK